MSAALPPPESGPTSPTPPSSAVPPPPPPPPPPPGMVAYGPGAHGAFSPFDRIGGLARWIGGLLAAWAVAQVVTTALTASLVDDAEAFLRGDISESDFLRSYAGIGVAGIAGGITTLGLIVLTMVWMYRLTANHRRLGRGGTWGPGWAIGGWFCPPVVLYVIPYLMFRMLWKGSDPSVPAGEPGWEKSAVSPVVTAWWVLYGLAPMVFIPLGFDTATGGISSGGTEAAAEQIADSAGLNVLSTLVMLASGVAYYLMVRALTRRQAALTGEATNAR